MKLHESVVMSPGEFIREAYLKELNCTERTLAKALGVTPSTVNRILNNKSDISYKMAMRLGKVFNTSAYFWINMQNQYTITKLSIQPDIQSMLSKLQTIHTITLVLSRDN